MKNALFGSTGFVGIGTSGVVLSTWAEAADKDYRLTVLEDCCGDNPEIHQFLTGKIFPKQAEVITSARWIEKLTRT